MIKQSVKVGVYGWSGFASGHSFYPEDMPPEWRLSFYANEFESACIDLAEPGLDSETLAESVEDLPAEFELALSVSAITQIESTLGLIEQRMLHAHWLIIDDRADEASADEILQHIENHIAASGPVGLLRYSRIWRPDNPVGSSAIALLPAAATNAEYRAWIEQWLPTTAADRTQALTLWCDAEIGYARLAELRTLVELMGL